MGCLENWQIFKVINPDDIFILYNCVGGAIGEVMFTCSCTVNCAFMLHLLGIICSIMPRNTFQVHYIW